MPTLIWMDPEDMTTHAMRPDFEGTAVVVNVPRSLITGQKLKLVRVDGASDAFASALMEDYS